MLGVERDDLRAAAADQVKGAVACDREEPAAKGAVDALLANSGEGSREDVLRDVLGVFGAVGSTEQVKDKGIDRLVIALVDRVVGGDIPTRSQAAEHRVGLGVHQSCR